jgi:polyisoprenoid-binding protein YceI
MECAAEASWEADIIIPIVSLTEEKEMAKKIDRFTNRKIVISFSIREDETFNTLPSEHILNTAEQLEYLLPGAKVVKAFSVLATDFSQPSSAASQKQILLVSRDEKALETASEIIRTAGFNPIVSNRLNIYKSKINRMKTTKWIIDPTHSEIQFKVRHLMVSWVTGGFKQFNATVETEGDDINTAKIHFTADINSISTNNDQRDVHLRTGDFFDAENHPQLTFESDKLEKIDEENYKLYGTLTMRGNSKKVALNVEYGGITQDPWGNTRTGFSITGKINRKDFGVSFGMVTETGGALLGYDVTINANVEFVKQTVAEMQAA